MDDEPPFNPARWPAAVPFETVHWRCTHCDEEGDDLLYFGAAIAKRPLGSVVWLEHCPGPDEPLGQM
jgi:hypothetical protein